MTAYGRRARLDRERHLDPAAVEGERTARMERAAGRRIDRVRHLALDRLALAPGEIEVGHRVEQHARVGVLRRAEHLARRRHFDDAAEIHHADAVRHVAHHRQIVADEQVGQAEAVLQVAHQVEDLRLHRDVERRGRLVADDELGIAGKRARDRDALALAAGELVRVFRAVRGIEADELEQIADLAGTISAASFAMPNARSGSATMSSARQRGLRLA